MDGAKIQAALKEMTGQRTVPSVWLRGQHIGGSDDVNIGISDGLFDGIPETAAKDYAGKAGVKPFGAEDGSPYPYVAAN